MSDFQTTIRLKGRAAEMKYQILLYDTFNGGQRKVWVTADSPEEAERSAVKANAPGFHFCCVLEVRETVPAVKA